jgi:hypothetical protein
VCVQTYLLKHYGPSKDANRLAGGCTSIALFDMGPKGQALAAGSGKGDVFLYTVPTPHDPSKPLLFNVGKAALLGGLTSLNVRPYQPAQPPGITHSPARTVKRIPAAGTTSAAPKKIDTRGRVASGELPPGATGADVRDRECDGEGQHLLGDCTRHDCVTEGHMPHCRSDWRYIPVVN